MGHPGLEFAWSGTRPTGPRDEVAILVGCVQNGIYTEARGALSLGREGDDDLIFATSHRPVPLAAASAALPVVASAADEKPDAYR